MHTYTIIDSHTQTNTKRSNKQLSFLWTIYKIIYVAAEPSVEKVQIRHVAAEPEFQYMYVAFGSCVNKL